MILSCFSLELSVINASSQFSEEIEFYLENSAQNLPKEHAEVLIQKIRRNNIEAMKHFDAATAILLEIPDDSDKKIGVQLFETSKNALGSLNQIPSIIIHTLQEHMASLGFDNYEEWEKIDFQLDQSERHFDLVEMYENVLTHFDSKDGAE